MVMVVFLLFLTYLVCCPLPIRSPLNMMLICWGGWSYPPRIPALGRLGIASSRVTSETLYPEQSPAGNSVLLECSLVMLAVYIFVCVHLAFYSSERNEAKKPKSLIEKRTDTVEHVLSSQSVIKLTLVERKGCITPILSMVTLRHKRLHIWDLTLDLCFFLQSYCSVSLPSPIHPGQSPSTVNIQPLLSTSWRGVFIPWRQF